MIKRLHHVGIAVNSLDESIPLYESILGIKHYNISDVPSQGAKVAFFRVGEGVDVELVEPTVPGGIRRFLEKRGQGLHHLCFEVDDVDRELKALAAKGVKLIDKQGRPGVAADIRKIGFVRPESVQGVLVELVECQEE